MNISAIPLDLSSKDEQRRHHIDDITKQKPTIIMGEDNISDKTAGEVSKY